MGPQDTVVVGLDGGGDPLTDAALCFGALVRTCLPAPPREPLAFTASIDINTSNSSYCEPNIDQYCVVAATAISIAPQVVVSARGLRALVLVAAGTIDVQGSIDVSSDVVRTLPGAGADPATCVRGSLPVDAGGGAGGSFGGRGGNGQAIAGANATPAPELMAMPGLRGGCPGQAGSAPDDPIGGGTGGPGGGAVALVAQTIVLEGRINASGGGGRGGPRGPSGGGGEQHVPAARDVERHRAAPPLLVAEHQDAQPLGRLERAGRRLARCAGDERAPLDRRIDQQNSERPARRDGLAHDVARELDRRAGHGVDQRDGQPGADREPCRGVEADAVVGDVERAAHGHLATEQGDRGSRGIDPVTR